MTASYYPTPATTGDVAMLDSDDFSGAPAVAPRTFGSLAPALPAGIATLDGVMEDLAADDAADVTMQDEGDAAHEEAAHMAEDPLQLDDEMADTLVAPAWSSSDQQQAQQVEPSWMPAAPTEQQLVADNGGNGNGDAQVVRSEHTEDGNSGAANDVSGDEEQFGVDGEGTGAEQGSEQEEEDDEYDAYVTLTHNGITYTLFAPPPPLSASSDAPTHPELLFTSPDEIDALFYDGSIHAFAVRVKEQFGLSDMAVALKFRNLAGDEEGILVHEETELAHENHLRSFWNLRSILFPDSEEPLAIELVILSESPQLKLQRLLERAAAVMEESGMASPVQEEEAEADAYGDAEAAAAPESFADDGGDAVDADANEPLPVMPATNGTHPSNHSPTHIAPTSPVRAVLSPNDLLEFEDDDDAALDAAPQPMQTAHTAPVTRALSPVADDEMSVAGRTASSSVPASPSVAAVMGEGGVTSPKRAAGAKRPLDEFLDSPVPDSLAAAAKRQRTEEPADTVAEQFE